jgi:hypothetical protein
MNNKAVRLLKNSGPAVDKSGKPITDAMIKAYEPMIKAIVMEFFETGELTEASMDFHDLVQHGRYHAQRCLRNFDENEAIFTVTKDDAKKRKSDNDHIAFKIENREEVLVKAREKWVRKTLYSEFRRLRYDYLASQRGGQQEPVDFNEVLAVSSTNGQRSFGADQQGPAFENINLVQGHADRDEMFEINEKHGQDAAIQWLNNLEPNRRENLLDYVRFTMNNDDRGNIYHLEFRKESEE